MAQAGLLAFPDTSPGPFRSLGSGRRLSEASAGYLSRGGFATSQPPLFLFWQFDRIGGGGRAKLVPVTYPVEGSRPPGRRFP
jgi:hypothetical protein